MENQQKQFALSLIAYGVQRSIAAERLCKSAGINLKALKKKSGVITKKEMDNLWHCSSQLASDPIFGLHFGEALQLSALGVIGEIIKSSRTVGEGIHMATSLTHLITDLFKMELIHRKQSFSIRLIPMNVEDRIFAAHQMADTLMAFTVHEMDGLLLKKIQPQSVVFPYSVSDSQEYERVLRCRPVKHKSEYSIQFDSKYLEEPILSENYELQNLLLQKIRPVSKDTDGFDVFSEKIHSYLMNNAYLGILSLEDVASNFNITPRSLQRRLQDEGVTFQQLSDSVRKSLALHYIQSGKHQIKEISDMLGYNEISAFSRAFKRWTGKAPFYYHD